MGWFDWIGKKKTDYQEKVREAVRDGKLTPEKAARLEALRQQADVPHISSDKTVVRRQAFNTAVAAVKSGGKLTAEEEAELAHIQKFLALRDDQVDKTHLELRRLKTVTEIGEGKLPVIARDSTVLRGIKLAEGEVAHYSAAADLFECHDPGPAKGVKVMFGAPYRFGSVAHVSLPLAGVKPRDSGALLLTNQRILFKGQRNYGLDISRMDCLNLYRDGLRLQPTGGHLLVKFRADGVSDIVATLISQLRK